MGSLSCMQPSTFSPSAGPSSLCNFQEVDEARSRLQHNKQVASFQMRQMEIKARKRAQARIEELQEAAQIQLTLREQEDIFRQYAGEWIEEYRRQGKTTVPMEIHLNKKTTVETMR